MGKLPLLGCVIGQLIVSITLIATRSELDELDVLAFQLSLIFALIIDAFLFYLWIRERLEDWRWRNGFTAPTLQDTLRGKGWRIERVAKEFLEADE